MKFIWLTIICSLTLQAVLAQTFIEPIAGIGFSKNSGYASERWYHGALSDKNFTNANGLFGLGIRRTITNKFSLQLTAKFSRQAVGYSDVGVVGYSILTFNRNTLSIIPTYQYLSFLEFGIGVSYTNLNNLQLGLPFSNFWSPLINKEYKENQLGWTLKFNYLYKSFVASLQYVHLYNINNIDYQSIKSARHFEFMITYRLKIFDPLKLKKKKVDCPKISK